MTFQITELQASLHTIKDEKSIELEAKITELSRQLNDEKIKNETINQTTNNCLKTVRF